MLEPREIWVPGGCTMPPSHGVLVPPLPSRYYYRLLLLSLHLNQTPQVECIFYFILLVAVLSLVLFCLKKLSLWKGTFFWNRKCKIPIISFYSFLSHLMFFFMSFFSRSYSVNHCSPAYHIIYIVIVQVRMDNKLLKMGVNQKLMGWSLPELPQP